MVDIQLNIPTATFYMGYLPV